uniref:ING domain-containing protein n=1 Tax=Parastrongyloides trichosuri TaxID=131310 RepID=A0A0N4Z2G1_PARTI
MEKFQKTYDAFSEDYITLSKLYERTALEMKEYQELSSTLKILTEFMEVSKDEDIKMQMNLNEYVYADAKIREKNKVVVKMIDDIYAELTYERAISFIESKMEILEKYLDDYKKEMAKIKAHMEIFMVLKYSQ